MSNQASFNAQPFGLAAARSCLPSRALDLHKKRAAVLVVAGSAQYLGAALLCSRGAFRAGAGLVHLALPAPLALSAMTALPELVVSAVGPGPALGKAAIERLLHFAASAQAVAVGPGLGRSPGTRALVQALWKRLPNPAVFDADALACLDLRVLPGGPRILTPHEGEAVLLMGPQILAQGRLAAVRRLAVKSHSVVVLKGPGTLVATPKGALSLNLSGSSVLATAGAGDVLTGAIAALSAQGAEPYQAARLGAWAHGVAAELWASAHAQRGLLASDLADALPRALARAGA